MSSQPKPIGLFDGFVIRETMSDTAEPCMGKVVTTAVGLFFVIEC